MLSTVKLSMCRRAVRQALYTGLVCVPALSHATLMGDVYDQFTQNDQITLTAVNYYKSTEDYVKHDVKATADRDAKLVEGMATQHEWGQSFGVFYNSGYVSLTDKIRGRLNVGYSHTFKLSEDYLGDLHNWSAGEKVFKDTDCFWSGAEPGTGQYKCGGTDGYGKVPVASLTLRWKTGYSEIGRGFFNVGMITTANPDDAMLSSYEGIMVNNRFGDYLFDAAIVNGFMAGNEDEMGALSGGSNYYTPSALEYDYLYTARIRRNFGKTGHVALGYGEASDYLRRLYTEAWYRHTLDGQSALISRVQYYYNHAAGDIWQQDVERDLAAFDEYASIISYDFTYKYNALSLMYGFSSVDAPLDSTEKTGSFSYGFGNAKGYLKLPTTGGYHGFRRDGTQAHVLGVVYDLRQFGLDDLSFAYRYHWATTPVITKSTGYDRIIDTRAYEHVVEVKYEPTAGPLKGFYANFKQSFFRPDTDYNQLLETDRSDKADNTAIKLLLGYSYKL